MISRIGKYTVEAELGRGGFGRVYRAFDPDVKRQVAIKVLIAESDPELLKRFEVEVGTTGNLRHKNIVTLYECGEQSGVPYLVMELLEGQPLDASLKQGAPLTLLDKVRIMAQVAEGLGYAHGQGVIHRDVKPANIMLLRDGSVKIMDFGIARVANKNTMVTREGFLVGTIPYMAPELFEPGGKADAQTDIFAYGAVYYELLTGKHPFSVEQDIYATIRRIQAVEPDAVCRVVPEAPEGLELLVHRAMGKDREVRYQDFAELLLDSEAILADLQHDRAAALLTEIRPLMETGELEAAESKLLQVLELDPGNREARQLRTAIKEESRKGGISKRIGALLAESEAQIKARQFGEAVQTLENAARLSKNDSMIQSRLSLASAKLNAHLQANKLVAEARRDQQKGQFDEALKRLNAAVDLDPGHVDANTLRGRVQAEVERRRLQDAIGRAADLLAQNRFDDALEALKPAETDPTGTMQTGELRARIERARADHEQRRRAEQFNMAIGKVRDTLQARDHDKAAYMLNVIEQRYGGEADAIGTLSKLRGQLDSQIREDDLARCLQEARELVRKKSLREALDLLNGAERKHPGDTGIHRLRESTESLYAAQQRTEAIAAAVNEANARRKQGDLRRALDVVVQAKRRLGDDSTLSDLALQIEVELEEQRYAAGLEELLRKVRSLVSAGNFDDAIRVIEDAAEYQGEPDVRELLASARSGVAARDEKNAVDAALGSARGFEGQGSLAQALAALEEALWRYPNNSALAKSAEKLRSRIAEEQRQAAIAGHVRQIGGAIADKEWRRAETLLDEARRAFPGETAFNPFAEQTRRGQFEDALDDAAREVRESLASRDVRHAVGLLDQGRKIYGGESVWKELDAEVAKHAGYELALGQAEQLRTRGELDQAEGRLEKLIRDGALDDRAAQLLGAIRDRRLADKLSEADRALGRGDFETGLTMIQTLRLGASPEWSAKLDAAYRQAEERKQQEIERQRQEKDAAISAASASIRERLERDDVSQAVAQLAAAKSKFPNESAWFALQREIDAKKKQLESTRREAEQRAAQAEKDRQAAETRRREEQAREQEAARKEQERLAAEAKQREAQERERAAQAEKTRLASEAKQRQEEERRRAEQAEKERLAAEAKRREEAEKARIAAEAKQRQEAERQRAEQAEKERLAAEGRRREEEARERQRLERDRAAQAEKERQALEAKQREQEAARAEQERLAAEARRREEERQRQLEQQRAEQAERERVALETKKHEEQLRARQLQEEQELARQRRERELEQQRIDTLESRRAASAVTTIEPIPAKKPFPAKLAVIGGAGLAAAIGAIVLIPRLFHSTPTPVPTPPGTTIAFEIRTDPPGASIKVGDQSCVTPNCRLSLPAGNYKIEAQLNGYEPASKDVALHTATDPGTVDLSLFPKTPTDLPKEGAATGTIVVKAGIADALVMVNNAPRGRTDSNGNYPIKLEAKSYEIGVQKTGYDTPPVQRVNVAKDATESVTFTLKIQDATLQIRGAPAGAEFRLNGDLLGKTDASGGFTKPVKPGDATLSVSFSGAKRDTPAKFVPGQTLALEWTSIAPPTKPVEPTTAEKEAQAWERIRASNNPTDFQNFLRDFPNGAHAAEAQSKIDDLTWAGTNQKDAASLRVYINRFPKGAHARDAASALGELAWNGTDKKDAQALRAFISGNPNSPHNSEAQTLIDQIEKARADAEQKAKDERARQDKEQQQGRAQAAALQAAVDRFNGAFASKQPDKAIKEVWPSVPSRYTDFMRGDKNNSIAMSLGACGEAVLSPPSGATLPCELTTTTTVSGAKKNPTKAAVNVLLQKRDAGWIIGNLTPR